MEEIARTMTREAHEKAAQYHEYAAKAHRRAADYLTARDQLAARDQARNAFDYSRFAYDLSARAKAEIEERLSLARRYEERLVEDRLSEERMKATAGSW